MSSSGDRNALSFNVLSSLDHPEEVANVLKAISDSTRLQLLYLVAQHGRESLCGCDLADALQVSAPTITHHMKKLVAAGLVNRDQRGKWAYFSINTELFTSVQQFIQAVQQQSKLGVLA